MRQIRRKSITGLMSDQHESHRLENLFYKNKESSYYLKNYGLDWDFFNSQEVDISVQSFLSYFTQEATKQGIIILEMDYIIENFTLKLAIKLLSEKIIYLNYNIK